MMRLRLIASLLIGALGGAANAQEVRLYRAGETPDARDVARILGGNKSGAGPDAAAPDGDEPARTRGFKLAVPATPVERIARPSGGNARPKVAAARREAGKPSALALGVQFTFDSAEIMPPARAQLDALADGVKLLETGRRVVIEGHTDATGSDEYNMDLSNRRALSVKQYLTTVHGIDEARLEAIGLGKTRPLDARDPFAVENRRVQFHGV